MDGDTYNVWASLADCLVVYVAPFKSCMCIAKISICGRIEEGKGITYYRSELNLDGGQRVLITYGFIYSRDTADKDRL